jgi:propionyl-CoA carboxylase beta chain
MNTERLLPALIALLKWDLPYRAAEMGFVDEIILPEQTRLKLIRALESLKNKQDRMPAKKHDNLPL